MSKSVPKQKSWQVTMQSVYSFGREERLQSAFEVVISSKRFKIREKKDDKPQDRALRESI
jgi:hypothetical protein